jgi:O-antigen/teichoic acid export membrane protein
LSAIKKFAGQTAIYGISTVIARFLNFFLTPVYVRLYSPKVYGIFSVMYSWASMLNALLAFGMETTYFRYLNKYENDKQKVYNNTFFTVSLIAFTFLLFSFLFVDDIATWIQRGNVNDPDYARYIKYFIYILVADALAVIPFAKLRADGRPIRYKRTPKDSRMISILGGKIDNIYDLFDLVRTTDPEFAKANDRLIHDKLA